MRLYHFTSPDHLPYIRYCGYLKTGESNVSAQRPHAGPNVVWLTSNPSPNPDQFGWTKGSFNDKTAIRFTVDIPDNDAQLWLAFAGEQHMDRRWRKALINTGGGDHRTWYVSRQPIPAAQWREIRDMRTDHLYPLTAPELNA